MSEYNIKKRGYRMENHRKHLELLQGVINRMSHNSFPLKGWAITMIVAMLALDQTKYDIKYKIILYIPVIMFWILDSYYLQQERLYRELYDDVRLQTEEKIDFSMKLSDYHLPSF